MGSAQSFQTDVYPRLVPHEGSSGEVRTSAGGSTDADHHRLRPISVEAGGSRAHPRVRRAIEAARLRVAEENTRSAGLSPDDIRLIMAIRVADALEGGRSAILRPDRRHSLVANAQSMGMRPFDANLIIAIVQDGARRGEHLDHHQTVSRLSFVGPTIEKVATRRGGRLAVMVMAVTLGVAWAAWLVAWLIGN